MTEKLNDPSANVEFTNFVVVMGLGHNKDFSKLSLIIRNLK